MLKYFKRQKSQRSSENDNDVAANGEKRNSLLSTSSFCEDILAEEDTQSLRSGLSVDTVNVGDEDIFKYHSRLSMSLKSILKDADCLTCFVQYLETRSALPIIKFYLDTENFKISALEQLTKQEQSATKLSNGSAQQIKNEAFENLNEEFEDEGDGDVEDDDEEANETEEASNNVPELKTLCDLSMHKPLTDDEKSQIYAETNKQITKCTAQKLKAYSEQSLCSELSLDSSTGAADETHNSHPLCSAASIKDALAIYQKYLSPNAKLFVELPVGILSNLSLLLCKRQDVVSNHDDDGKLLPVSVDCFDEAQQFIFNELESSHLNEFLQSPFYCKYCLELIIDEQLNIKDILYSEVTLFYFMEFLEQHCERECLDFWTAAINFRKSYANPENALTDPKVIQEDAMIIYKKFFSLQSEQRLWLSDKLRLRVEECICAPSALEIANCFDLALMVMAKYLEKKYFNAFLNSEIFAQYLNELKTKINESHGKSRNCDELDGSQLDVRLLSKGSIRLTRTPANSKKRHRKTLSDCTNDTFLSNVEAFKHISQHNTLLAMDTSGMHLKNLQSTATSMSIDARQLTNPKLLWHRRYSNSDAGGGLKFGRVNALGRYERDFETIESFNNLAGAKNHWSLSASGSKIKNAMRKLVNLPEHNAQEEIAWQIAEMIVKDVTSVTLNNPPNVSGTVAVKHAST